MQIEFVLRWPFTAPQFAQCHPVQAGTQELGDRAIACTVIGQDVCNGSGNSGITPDGLSRLGGWCDAVGRCKRGDAFQRLPEQVSVLFRFFLHKSPQ